MTETGMFFEKKGPVWDSLRALQQRLADAGIDYVVIGGMALNAYNYSRQTLDVDIVVRESDLEVFKREFVQAAYQRTPNRPRRFIDNQTSVDVDILIAGRIAGDTRKNRDVVFPSPDEAVIVGDLRTVTLPRLIELKLVTWRFKDWGDVVELIRRNNLAESLADQLHSSVRSAFGECCDQAQDSWYDEPV